MISETHSARGIPRRLDFRLPDFTRIAWASDAARQAWEPILRRIVEMLSDLEWRTVAAGLRPCTLASIRADRLAGAKDELSRHGIEIVPLDPLVLRASYAASLERCAAGAPSGFYCALGRGDDLRALCEAYRRGDQRELGRLSGCPDCCVDFFQEIWCDRRMVDTTWPMAARTKDAISRSDWHIELARPSPCGVQLRWLGARRVFHLPCSFNCAESIRIAGQVGDLASELGYAEELRRLDEMLAWPVEWSALHGIAEIKTPVAKIVTRTDATPEKYLVRYLGDPSSSPEQAASGLVFPYRSPRRLPVVATRAFRLGLENPITDASDETTGQD